MEELLLPPIPIFSPPPGRLKHLNSQYLIRRGAAGESHASPSRALQSPPNPILPVPSPPRLGAGYSNCSPKGPATQQGGTSGSELTTENVTTSHNSDAESAEIGRNNASSHSEGFSFEAAAQPNSRMILAGSAIASPTGAGKYYSQGDYPDPDWQSADIRLDRSYQANDIPSSSPPASVTSGALPHNHGIGGASSQATQELEKLHQAMDKIKSEFDERLRVTRHPAEENMIGQGNKITTPAALSNIPQLYHIIFQYVDQGANL
ncbi:hypothetical protein EV424DRAFT_1534182 [Suillus variegatus]|nr:hypothetical protein EV424DRAFT_1534182 [Suillus variegatus]